MATAAAYPHLTTTPTGEVRIGRTRYSVLHLAGEHYHYGWSADELQRQHPDLRPEEVYAALTYFYDHFDALTAALDEQQQAAERDHVQPVSRSALLRRRSGSV